MCNLRVRCVIRGYNVLFAGTIYQMEVLSVKWGYNVSNGGIMCQIGVKCVVSG